MNENDFISGESEWNSCLAITDHKSTLGKPKSDSIHE